MVQYNPWLFLKFILQNVCLASGYSLCTCVTDYSSLSTNLVLVLIKLHSASLFKAISSVVNTISSPSQQRVSSPCRLSASWYHCCHHRAWARFCSKLSSLAIICLFSVLLPKDSGLPTWKPAIPREWHGFWSSMCPHTKIWLTQRSSLFRGIKNSSSRTNSITYLRLSVWKRGRCFDCGWQQPVCQNPCYTSDSVIKPTTTGTSRSEDPPS